MASLLSNLKKQRTEQLEKATKGLEDSGGRGKREVDERFWKLTPDSNGNAAAIIRFLPAVHEEDEMPWVKLEKYGFKIDSTGKWYFNNSLATIGKEDPVSKDNYRLWNEVGTDEAKNMVRTRKRHVEHIFNIYVIKDVNFPENEGKNFLFRAGKQIFGMIQAQAKPEVDPLATEAKDPVYVWDLWEGANFRFKAYTADKFLKYDKSTFDEPSVFLNGDEDKIESVLKGVHKLAQFVAPDQFKTFDELQKELDRVMGVGSTPAPKKDETLDDFEQMAKDQGKVDVVKKGGPKPEAPKSVDESPSESTGDADLDYFKSLLAD